MNLMASLTHSNASSASKKITSWHFRWARTRLLCTSSNIAKMDAPVWLLIHLNEESQLSILELRALMGDYRSICETPRRITLRRNFSFNGLSAARWFRRAPR